MIEKITPERINRFLEGYDPMERIINIECSYDDKEAIIIYNDAKGVKRIKKEAFYPFVWAKQSAARQLYGGDRNLLLKKMNEYGIGTKGLNIYNNEGKTTERLENGYRVMFYAKYSMNFKRFSQFFIEGKKPIYSNDKNSNSNSKEFLAITPVEQFMIATGKRMFKGYDDYDQLKRLEWDLETEGLEAERCLVNQVGIRTNKGFAKIITIEGSGEEKLENELTAIRECLKIIANEKPDVITGHNSENFDWDFLIKRLEILGTSMQIESAKFFPKPIYKKKKQSVLKLGGEIEYYYPTVIWGFNVTDSLHAVRRAQAQDSNMKKADLKYVTKYSNLNKPNRVYVPGNDINATWADTVNDYAFNNSNGHWFKITDKTFEKTYSDVIDRKQLTFYTDEEIENASKKILEVKNVVHDKKELLELENELVKLTEIANGNKFEEIIEDKIRYTLLDDGTIRDNSTNEIFVKTTGRYIVERYLLDDLEETDKVELRYNQSNFLLGKLLPTTFGKVCTMGTAATWKMIMLAWSYENNLALPSYASSGAFTGGLSRLLSVGYVDRVVKLDYNSLYPSIILSWMISTGEDISGVMLSLLEYILSEREKFKDLKKGAGKKAKKKKEYIETFLGTTEELMLLKEELQKYESEESANDKKQLPFKIFGNSFFGGFGAPNLFNWGDLMCAEKTTCIGRQSLRLMNKWFRDRGYKPIVMDTDGVNFQMPPEYELNKRHYIGKGLNRNTVEGKEYNGVEADVAEFNDLFMRGKMGLGIDEYARATINFSRKNYADYLENGQVKLVGNTIKSKKMPLYIEKFLNKAIELLLFGKGQEFLMMYYDYIDKIYNLKIPLKEIASVGKIKKDLSDYIKDCNTLTAAGSKKARQAWYELAIKHNLNVHMGDAIYYINTGKSKSHSDVKRITHYYIMENGQKIEITKDIDKMWNVHRKKLKEESQSMGFKSPFKNKLEYAKTKYDSIIEEDELIFNCILLDNEIVEDENDTFCDEETEYNVQKYLEQFNKRIKPLLVCFSTEIRDKILITNPEDRNFFTVEQSKLVAGEPYKTNDQDTYEQLMTIEDKEIKFWKSVNEIPPFVEECGIDWNNVLNDYNERQKVLEETEIKDEVETYNKIIDSLTKEDVNNFIEDGILPNSLLKIVEEDVNSNNFISKKWKVVIGNIFDIIDKDFDKISEEIYNSYMDNIQ